MKNFGKTLLKVFLVALVFGIVAASAFAGMTYFYGEQFGVFPFMVAEAPEPEELPEETEEVTEEKAAPPETETEEKEEKKAEDAKKDAPAQTAEVKSDADIVEEVMPSIVSITNLSTIEYNTFWGQRGSYESESAGSGIIVTEDDDYLYIVTNAHVVEGAESLFVQFVDDERVEGSVKGEDSSRDLAVVELRKADIPSETLDVIRIAEIGDSTALRVGESAIAIGNALGYGQSITKGVISALNREVTVTDPTTGITIMNVCIQTDAAINPGNSGGALLNSKGEVIGINEIKYSSTQVEGIGYAIPMATAQPVIEQIISKEAVVENHGAFLGIEGIDITDEDAEKYNMPKGLYIAQVVPGSGAERAGLQIGDVITEVDGTRISTREELTQILSQLSAGDQIEITFMRTDQGTYVEHSTIATLGTRND